MLVSLLNKKSDLSVRNGELLYKQLARPMMYCAFLAWRSAARNHVRRVQVLQSMCLRLATGAPWYVSNRHTRGSECSAVSDHIRALTASFNSKLADVGNP
jgi:4-amino-4-deoxy-L-arabinose transferase-like glycosyltransferase